MFGFQYFLGLGQCVRGLGVEVGFAQVGVEHLSGEVVSPRVHQADLNGGVHVADIHESCQFHGLRRGAFLGMQRGGSQAADK